MAGSVDIGTLIVKYGADVKPLLAGNAEAAASIKETGAAASGIGSMVATGLLVAGVAAVGLGVKAVKMAGDFQSSMTGLVTGAGESASNLKMVSDGILNMATSTGTSTKQLADGMFMIESAGYHGSAGLAVLQASAEGAKVGNADLGTVADATTTIMKDFANQNVTSAQAVNTLIATVSNGKTHMQDLAGALSSILPTASAAKIKMTDVMGAMAAMTGEGIPAADAATYLRQTIIGLEAPSSGAAKAMASVGLSSTQVASDMQKSLPGTLKEITDAVGKKFPEGSAAYVKAIKDISGGSKTMQGMLALTGQHMKDFQTDVGNVAGAVKKGGDSIAGWGDVTKNFNFKMDQAKGAVEGLGIKIGTALLPIVGTVVDFFTGPVMTALSQFGTQIGNTVGPVIKQIGDALSSPGFKDFAGSVGQGVVQAFKDLGTAALNMDPLVNTIEGVVSHGKELTDWFNTSVMPAINQAKPGFKQLGEALAGLLPAFEQIAQVMHDNFQKSFDALLPVFKEAVPIIIEIAGAIAGGLGTAIKFLTPYIVQAATAIGQFASDIATRVAPIIKQWLDEFNTSLPALKAIWDTIWPSLSVTLRAAWDTIVGIVKIAWALLSGIIKIGLDIMSGNWKQAWEDFKTMLSGVWDGIQTILGGAIQQLVLGFKPLFQMLANIPGPVGDMGKNVLKAMNSMNAGVSDQTTQMRVNALNNVALMHLKSAEHFDQMKTDLIKKMQDTSDPVQKKALDMKINVVQHMEDMQVQAAQKAEQMKKDVIKHSQDMSDQMVGHSIIPDMVTNVLACLTKMATTGAATALTAGSNIVSNIASGITNGIGAVGTAISSVVATIDSYLPHSPAKVGPLRTLPQAGASIVAQLGAGMLASGPNLQATMTHVVAYPIRPSATVGMLAATAASAGGGSSSSGNNTYIFEVDSTQLATMVQKSTDRMVRLKLGAKEGPASGRSAVLLFESERKNN